MPLGKVMRDLAVEHILADLLGIAQQRIAEAAGPGLLVDHQRAGGYRPGNLAWQRAALIADLDEVPRRSPGLAAIETVGLEGDAVGTQLQQRFRRQNAIA